nr:MAG TPA: hypothetical protein [Bacteriophage sp.]
MITSLITSLFPNKKDDVQSSPFIQCLCGFAVFLLLRKIAGDERIELH